MLDPQIQLERRLLLTPCASKEGLRNWLITYLDIDLPDQIVDPDSNSTPLGALWQMYSAMLRRDTGFYRRVLMYAARTAWKTVLLSLLELLGLLHLDRSSCHLAAQEDQAQKAQRYLRAYLSRPGLDELNAGNNKRTLAVAFAEHKETGDILTQQEYKDLERAERKKYWHYARYVKVLVATMSGTNSEHQSLLLIDEAELIANPHAYDEAKMIPEDQRSVKGELQPPLTVITSSRKFSQGIVQREIDESEKTGTAIWHWGILDVTQRCPDRMCRPDLDTAKIWVNDEELVAVTAEGYEKLTEMDPKKAGEYAQVEVSGGCVGCFIAPACKGRLVRVTDRARLLKRIDDTIGKFRDTSVELAQCQLLSRKPGNFGGIYRFFSRSKHMLSVSEMWETITGDVMPSSLPRTKESIIQLLISRGCRWVAGMDFGFSHLFAVCLFAVDGRRAFLIDAFEVGGLELLQKIALCDRRIKRYNPICWPDVAYPSDIASFRRCGYRMMPTKKDVLPGIDAVRAKLSPAGGADPEMFMLRGDVAGDLLARRIEGYKWKLNGAGDATDIPDETDDDLDDAVRYAIYNTFRPAGKVVVSRDAPEIAVPRPGAVPRTWMTEEIQARIGGGSTVDEGVPAKIRKGGFFFDAT